METVFKYKLVGSDRGAIMKSVEMPKDAKFLTVAFQGEDLCLWAEVDTDAQAEWFTFEVFATGEQIYQNMGVARKFIGTVFISGLVFHVYHRIN